MEKYKKTLKIRILLLRLLLVLGLILCLIQSYMDDHGKIPDSFKSLANFQSGVILGMSAASLFILIRYCKLLKNERKLREEFNKETDERMILIRSRAGMPALLFTSVIIIFAGIAAGYFNTIVFRTLVVTGTCQLILGVCLKLYYMHKL